MDETFGRRRDTLRSGVFSVVESAYWGLQENVENYPCGFCSYAKLDDEGPTLIKSVVQGPFEGHRLVIPDPVVAPYFEIGDVWVGSRRQRGFGRWRPAMELSDKKNLNMDHASIGDPIAIEVRNISGEPRVFSAALIGRTLMYPSLQSVRERKHARDVSTVRAVARALFGGTDPDHVLLNRIRCAAFAVVERAYWGLHEAEPCELELHRAAVRAEEGTVVVSVSATQAFEGEHLVVSPDIAEHFSLIDVKVGAASQLSDTGEVPMQAFTNVPGVRLVLDRAHPKQDISLAIKVIKNETETPPQDFSARVVGWRLKRPRHGGQTGAQVAGPAT